MTTTVSRLFSTESEIALQAHCTGMRRLTSLSYSTLAQLDVFHLRLTVYTGMTFQKFFIQSNAQLQMLPWEARRGIRERLTFMFFLLIKWSITYA